MDEKSPQNLSSIFSQNYKKLPQFFAMKIPQKITAAALCIVCLLGMRTDMPGEEDPLGHACGEATSTLEILVIDAQTQTPSANVNVTFFDKEEVWILDEIKIRQEAGLSDLPKQPSGVSAKTDSAGKALLMCKVNYYKNTLANGTEAESISPRGRLRLDSEGYRTWTQEMSSLFSKTSLKNRTSLPPLKVYIKKGINRPPLPENVIVSKIDFMVLDDKEGESNQLSSKFFNQPEEYIFDEVTSDNWRNKWQKFSRALIGKAQQSGLDAASLERCISALNQGKNLQTAAVPFFPLEMSPPPDAPEEEQKAYEKKNKEQQAAYKLAMKEREENPDPYYMKDLAIIPVGAYLARHAKGECWIIVCKWEYMSENAIPPRSLGHIMIWAMDTKTAKVIAYTTCD